MPTMMVPRFSAMSVSLSASGLADIGRSHLSLIEQGVRNPTLEIFYKTSRVLSVKSSEILRSIEFEMEK